MCVLGSSNEMCVCEKSCELRIMQWICLSEFGVLVWKKCWQFGIVYIIYTKIHILILLTIESEWMNHESGRASVEPVFDWIYLCVTQTNARALSKFQLINYVEPLCGRSNITFPFYGEKKYNFFLVWIRTNNAGNAFLVEFYFPIKIVSEWKIGCERHASPKPVGVDILFQWKSTNNCPTCSTDPLR